MSNERLSEEDVKRIYITPAITNAGWRDIRMEYFTDGRVHVASNGVMTRGKRKYADYLLRYPSNINLAEEYRRNCSCRFYRHAKRGAQKRACGGIGAGACRRQGEVQRFRNVAVRAGGVYA